MLVFAGHHIKSQGFANEISSELIEASIVGALACHNSPFVFAGSSTSKDKAGVINTICDSLNIEIHFSTDEKNAYGPRVLFKDKCNKSEFAALKVQSILNSELNSNNNTEIGYYHSDERFGIDYFFKSDWPSIIICPDHWDKYSFIAANREKNSAAINKALYAIMEN